MNPTERRSRTATFALLVAGAALLVAPLARADEPGSDTTPPSPDSTSLPPPPPETPAPAPAPEGTPAPAPTPAPAEKTEAPPVAAPAASGGTDPLTGVPLGPSGIRQQSHVITTPPGMAGGRFEVEVTVAAQINPKFTETAGNGLELKYHFSDPFALVLGGTYNWQSQPTPFTDQQLLTIAQQAPTTGESISATWEGHIAFEATPVYGKMAFFETGTLFWGFYLGAGGGLVGTEIELQPPSSGVSRTTGNTGTKPSGFFNGGFRLIFNDHLGLNLEIRDVVFSAWATTIRGCDETDVNYIGNGTPNLASSQCQAAYPGSQGKADAHIAASLLGGTQDTFTNNDLQFLAGLSWLF